MNIIIMIIIKLKLWNMKVTVISIVIGMLSIVTKRLIKRLEDLEIRGGVETIQTTTLLRSARIQKRILETSPHQMSVLDMTLNNLMVRFQ